AAAAIKAGRLAEEIVPVSVAQKKGDPLSVATDEHPRATTLESLAKLKGVVRSDGTVTAGNASGVNDGACALILASEESAHRRRPGHRVDRRARLTALFFPPTATARARFAVRHRRDARRVLRPRTHRADARLRSGAGERGSAGRRHSRRGGRRDRARMHA